MRHFFRSATLFVMVGMATVQGAAFLTLSGGCATLKPQARAIAQDAQPYISWLDSAQAALTAVAAVVAPFMPADTEAAVSCGLAVLADSIAGLKAASAAAQAVLADSIAGLKAASAAAQAEDANQQWAKGVEAASNVRQALVDAGVTGI